jgi:hypothetical protein
MAPNHCYLIICPDPCKEHQLKITGVSYGITNDSFDKPKESVSIKHEELHFIKFGDEGGEEGKGEMKEEGGDEGEDAQKKMEKRIHQRVDDYRTHNPSCKFCHTSIAFDPGFDVFDSLVANNHARSRCHER